MPLSPSSIAPQSQGRDAVRQSPASVSREAIETAYCLLHQKLRVYEYSSMEWQRDDIEYAIAQHVGEMPADLYNALSNHQPDFLLDHLRFEQDMRQAVELMEQWLQI